MKNQNKVSVVTLGCSKNTVDSERLLRQIQANNINITENPSDADTVIINTCGFIDAAKEESVNSILEAVAMKKRGEIKKVIVAGCLSERYMNDLNNEIPEVDVFFGTENYEEILNELEADLKYDLLGERLLTTPSHTAYLKISEGCDNPCSFCAIPLMRGTHKSKPIEKLIEEAEFLARNNTKELVIIGQDTSDYGKDIYGKRNLAELLSKLIEVKGIEWIRLMYVYPSHFPEDVLDLMKSSEKICNYIDIPLQHISDDVLKSMRRGITKKRTIEVLNTIREKLPNVSIRTTFITGYPNETNEHFNELYQFIKEFKFDRVGVFPFSIEENTPSFLLGDKISEKEKRKRKDALMELQQEISLEINNTFIGKELKILIERIEGEFYIGRSYRDAPEVDGEVLIPIQNGKIIPGSFVNALVYDANEYDLFARIIKKD